MTYVQYRTAVIKRSSPQSDQMALKHKKIPIVPINKKKFQNDNLKFKYP